MRLRTQDNISYIPNELLKYAREQKGLTQEGLAEKLGDHARKLGLHIFPKSGGGPTGEIDAKTIRLWEAGKIRRPDTVHKKVLEDFFDRNIEALGFTKKGKPSFWNLPQKKNELFTGRESILAQLASVPFSRNEHNRTKQECESPLKQRPQVLTGLAGVGKTQIAVAYAYGFCHEYHTIFLLDADPRLLPDKVVFAQAVAKALGLPTQDTDDSDALVAEVQGWFTSEILTRWLLIFDNVDSPQAVKTIIEDFLPQDYYGHVLLISRMDDPGAEGYDLQHIPVISLSDNDGASLLLRRSGIIKSKALITDASEDDRQQAKQLSSTLGGLPLALDQAGAYIRTNRKTLHDYVRLYETRRTGLLRNRGEYGFGHPDSVVTTWSLNFEQIGQEARELLRFFAFLSPDAIPEDLVTTGASKLGPILESVASDELRLDTTVKKLLKYSLITRLAHEKAFIIHRLVQEVIQDEMEEEEQRIWAERAVAAVFHVLPDYDILDDAYRGNPLQEEAAQRCQCYLPQGLACIQHIKQWNMSQKEAILLIYVIARYYFSFRVQFFQAERLLRYIVPLVERGLVPENPFIIVEILDYIAFACQVRGEDTEAEQLYQRVLAMTIAEQRSQYIVIALNCLTGLGVIYGRQKRFAEIETLRQQTLDISHRPDDARVALAFFDTMAALYRHQEMYKQAEAIREHLIELMSEYDFERAVGYKALAELYIDEGENYAEAESLLDHALLVFSQGPHPIPGQVAAVLLANTYFSLGQLYSKQERFEDAEGVYRQSLSIFQETYGDAHLSVVIGLHFLAKVCLYQARIDDALSLYEKRVVYAKKTFGEQHSQVARGLYELGKCHHSWAQCIPTLREIDESYTGSVGVLGHFEEAKKYYTNALDMFGALGEQKWVEYIQNRLEELSELIKLL